MGNCCSNFNDKHKPLVPELHLREFQSLYKSLKFPQNINFTGDPSIFRIQHTQTNELYILKRISFPNEQDLVLYTQSLDTAIHLEHDTILKIYHYSVEKNQLNNLTICYTLNIILENFTHTLQDELLLRSSADQSFAEVEVQGFMNSLVDALEFLQLKGLSHGDIKPLGIYITKKKKAKIMFLGSTSSDKIIQGQDISCIEYMSPQVRSQAAELLFSERSSPASSPTRTSISPTLNIFKSDVFSLGLVVLDMMYQDKSSEVGESHRESIKRKFRDLHLMKMFAPFLCGVVKSMLRENEKARPDFIELKKMMMLQEYIATSRALKEGRSSNDDGVEEGGDGDRKMASRKWTDEQVIPEEELETDKDNSDRPSFKINSSGVFEETGENKDESRSQKSHGELVDGNDKDVKKDKIEKISLEQIKTGSDEGRHQLYENYDEEEDDVDIEPRNYDEMVVENEQDLYSLHQKQIGTLHKLVINLEENELVEDTCNMLQEVIQWQRSLNDIVLSLPKANLGNDGFEAVCTGISGLKDLATCYFDFRKSNMSDLHLEKLVKSLLKQDKLVQVALNFSDNSITVEGCRQIATWLHKLKEVKSLALNIGGNRVGNEGIIAIGKELGKMKELESLTVFLYTNDLEGKEGVSALLKGIKEMENLEKINLNLVSNLLKDEELDIILGFTQESEVEEIIIDLKDNCVSEEGRKRAKIECIKHENVIIRF